MMKITDLMFYGVLLLRRLPVILLITGLAGLVGLVIAQSQSATYRGTATVLVESPDIPDDLARSTVLENAVVQVQIIEQQLLTDRSLLALAERFEVYPEGSPLADFERAQDMRSRIVVEQSLLGDSERSAIAFKISFDAPRAALAADVANYLATTIVARGSERRSARATETLAFFQQEVAQLTAELAALDAELFRFKSEHVNDLPDSLDFRRTRQTTYEERLLLLEREATTLRNRRASLVTFYQVTGKDIGGANTTPQGQLLADLQRALLTQSTIYGPDSFPVQALNERIAQLKPQVGAATSEARIEPPTSELDLQLADIDDQLAAIAEEDQAIRQSLEALEASISATPQNETTVDALERRRTSTQSLYVLAVERLAEATTGAEIEARLKGERLSMVEAAVPPENALPTKKRLIVAGAFGGGLAAALALMLVFEILNRRVRRPVELERQLSIRPMVTIPYVPSASDLVWRRAVLTASVLILGAIAALVPVASYTGGVPMANIAYGLGAEK